MTMVTSSKDKRLEQRVSESQRELIVRGAEARGKSVSEFVVESACLAAELAIMEQRVFFLDSDSFDSFLAKLDQPPQANPGLEKLFSKRASWLA